MLKVSELRALDKNALTSKVNELKRKLFEIKFSKHTSGLEKPHMLTQLKRDIARCLTVLNSKGE
jgi:large subunit ribosomal protein L29